MTFDPHNYDGNVARFSGFADLYDRHRAAPPEILAELLTRLTGVPKPGLVVDIGSGTGLSTRYWRGKSKRVIGIEPTADMRVQAEAAENHIDHTKIQYIDGFSYRTGLPDDCADIVTCAQSLHWMEPHSTFQEVERILEQVSDVIAGEFQRAYPANTPFRGGVPGQPPGLCDCIDRHRE